MVANSVTPSASQTIRNLRDELMSKGIIQDLCFTKDFLFNSPSTAAGVVMGRNANGLTEWKTQDGNTLRDVLSTE